MSPDGKPGSDDEDTRIRRLDPVRSTGPPSVVKELVENAIGADASRVTVAVETGEKEDLRVSDDGVGMTEADARPAVEKHTTSKMTDIEDIEADVSTLGFRGEALAAIGAVSRLSIRTKPRSGVRGTELTMAGGDSSRSSRPGVRRGRPLRSRTCSTTCPPAGST